MKYLLTGLIGVVCAFWWRYAFRPSHEYLKTRELDFDRWKRLFSEEDLPIALSCLRAIKDSFLLRRKDVYRLQPSDRLMDIYEAAYPVTSLPDSLEFETLYSEMRDRFQVTESNLGQLSQLTVVEVLELCVAAKSDAP